MVSASKWKRADDNAVAKESKEFASVFLGALAVLEGKYHYFPEFHKVEELIIGIASSRGKRWFSPRENAQYLIAFNDACSQVLSELINDPSKLYQANLELNAILDHMTILTFEAFMKGREMLYQDRYMK